MSFTDELDGFGNPSVFVEPTGLCLTDGRFPLTDRHDVSRLWGITPATFCPVSVLIIYKSGVIYELGFWEYAEEVGGGNMDGIVW